MLFAQSAERNTNGIWLAMWIVAGVTVSLFVFVLFIVLLLRYSRANRQLLHTERMRSIEAGFPLESHDPTKIQATHMHNAFWISFWIVFGVPAAAFSAASATTKVIDGSRALGIVIWIGAAAASVAAVVCATVLMIQAGTRPREDVEGFRKPPKPV